MTKDQCRSQLELAADVVQEMQEMLDSDDGIQAFVEAYESATEHLTRAMTLAVTAAIPEPCFLDDGQPLEPPPFINRPRR